jgi:DNA-binding transcriptional regulator YiaG
MNRTHELLRQMMDDPSGEMLRPARKTVLVPQPGGSIVRRVTDAAGKVTEDTISAEQRLSLDARVQLEMSQQQFAAMLGISVRTLHDWEQGRREPSGAARTLLKIAARHPEVVREVLECSACTWA